MTAVDLRNQILDLSCDILFQFNGKHACINPCTRENITVGFGDKVQIFTDIDDLMNDLFFDGRALTDIAEGLEISTI